MSHKKLVLFAIPLFVVLATIIYVSKTFNSVGVFLFDFSVVFSVICGILFFVRNEAFRAWSKFTMFFLPLSVAFVLLVPKISSDPFFPIEKKIVSFSLAVVFLVVSILIITFKSIQLRKEEK